jgi:phenylpropionate dioxygenase-like ring-hydroxylating dioxygenase large terminal subunit
MMSYPEAVHESWLPVAAVQEVKDRPLARRLHGVPIAIFRSGDGFGVMRDRCPHRNVPLSDGRVIDGQIVCPYHGWAFSPDGQCRAVPGSTTIPSVSAEALPVRTATGMIFATLGTTPRAFPHLPAPLEDGAFDHFLWPIRSRATLIDAIENLLDPAHPHYLHPGIVRSSTERNPVRVEIRESGRSIEAVYHEDARPQAWMPRLLEGKRLTSIGRFFPPTTAQIAFESEAGARLVITVLFSPESNSHVQAFAHFATPKGRIPAAMKEWILRAFHRPVLRQDQDILARQVDNIERFGSHRYALGPLDYLKVGIVKLMQGHDLEERVSVAACRL